jgi:N-methylhydantoinase B
MNPAELQVFASRLYGLAEQMGTALVKSSRSANIKERRDCSTAIFDSRCEMVAQAEHIPAHLGALPDAVVACAALGPRPGDVFIVNDPFSGGNHLPDITLVSPFFSSKSLVGYAASRAHHADVGGREPGSMPAGATSIFEEGLRIPPMRLVREGRLDEELLNLLASNMRNPDERRGDLQAQLAAQHVGARGFEGLVGLYGLPGLPEGMAELLDYAERRMRAAIRTISDGVYCGEDVLEGDGIHTRDIPIRVTIVVEDGAVKIDFTGTASAQSGNVNCPLSVTKAACYFALRVICGADLPASGGTFRPVEVTAPPRCLVNAQYPSAVAAGNVETSSRIADTVLLALSVAVELIAQGQGTMNNVVLGNDHFTYYETIGGGQGADCDGHGSDAVHVAMSNTLNTPIEALELEYPLRVERYAVRRRSGGDGQFRGGRGVVRSIRVLEPCRLSILSERRRHAPSGVAGGTAGAPGRNSINGEKIPAKFTGSLAAGDVVTIETPGGGGFGLPSGKAANQRTNKWGRLKSSTEEAGTGALRAAKGAIEQ